MALFDKQNIFEAKVVGEPDYKKGVCSVEPITGNKISIIDNIPIPQILGGFGNAGMFGPLYPGSRVICARTDGRGNEAIVILHVLPTLGLQRSSFKKGDEIEGVRAEMIPYPEIVEGRVVIRGGTGSNKVILDEKGEVEVSGIGSAGMYIVTNRNKAATTIVSEDLSNYSSAGKVVSGNISRVKNPVGRLRWRPPDVSKIPLFADVDYKKESEEVGLFPGSPVSLPAKNRNPALTEHRTVINEFATDSMFTGFDDELLRSKGETDLFSDSDTHRRNRYPGSILHMAEHELVEIIAGNVVDINGNVLDLNYRALEYGEAPSPGSPNTVVPKTNKDEAYDRAKKISRRGIGYHFQLSTNTLANEPSNSVKNLVFDVDKEGVIKLNVPASSENGNIPFSSIANFLGNSDNVEVDFYGQKTREEPIPATLRDLNGNIVFPDNVSELLVRETGVRFENNAQNPYFPTPFGAADKEFIRVNTTKYHNMYATAERLIANTITELHVPKPWTDPDGKVEGNSAIVKSYEWKKPEILKKDENLDQPSTTTKKHQEDVRTAVPTFMSLVFVEPGPPAIYSGGDTVVAGKVYDGDEYDPVTNFVDYSGTSSPVRAGGQSAHLNFEGSITTSIGKDDVDGKSILLDTDGSMVSWFGNDENGRSFIMQTDGAMLVNVGGSYNENNTHNDGRFELRVNITDKGFVNEEGSVDSDIIISLSEDGIIIAGMKPELPMTLRNEGKILIESVADIILKGQNVKIVGPGGEKVLKPPSAGSSSPFV